MSLADDPVVKGSCNYLGVMQSAAGQFYLMCGPRAVWLQGQCPGKVDISRKQMLTLASEYWRKELLRTSNETVGELDKVYRLLCDESPTDREQLLDVALEVVEIALEVVEIFQMLGNMRFAKAERPGEVQWCDRVCSILTGRILWVTNKPHRRPGSGVHRFASFRG